MKNKRLHLLSLLAVVLAASAMLLSACGDESLEEPAIYTPAQIRRLLTDNAEKVWLQSTEYYLEDSCRTGYKIRFAENAGKNLKMPFIAHFYRDTGICPGADSLLALQAFTPKLPQFVTTDSLAFLDTLGGDSTLILSQIRLLTNELLMLQISQPDGSIQEAEFRALFED